MSRLDLVIFGATGFTGKYAAAEMVRIAENYTGITWGIAGRSKGKLEGLLNEIALKSSKDLSEVAIIEADVGNEESLQAMCRRARVLVNCCGPYRFLGEPVVRAAVNCGAHYVDISGEPQFMESMQLHYDAAAREAGVYVVSACGFDSIPADLGVVFLQQNFQGTLHSVEAYLSGESPAGMWREALRSGAIHYGTWESLIYSLAHRDELPALRARLYPDRLPPSPPRLATKLIHRHAGHWCLPFPGADGSVVHRTQRHLHATRGARPTQFRAYLQMGLLSAVLAVFWAALALVMTSFNCTRRLMLNYPRLFSFGMVSHGGPSEALQRATRFQFELVGRGWVRGEAPGSWEPDQTMVAKVSGTNPGYGATVVALLISAVTILNEKDSMPSTGGVMTPGAAFGDTSIIQTLNKNELTFEIVPESNDVTKQ